jgi:hypothetical protein
MEENNTTTQQKPQGKGMGTAGFVISLVALVLWIVIAGIATAAALVGGGMGLAIFWLVFSLLGTGLSVMGMMKLGKSGGKKGLAITGMVLGIVATILSVTTVLGVKKVHSKVGDTVKDAFENLADTAKLRETMNNAMQEMADSLKVH